MVTDLSCRAEGATELTARCNDLVASIADARTGVGAEALWDELDPGWWDDMAELESDLC